MKTFKTCLMMGMWIAIFFCRVAPGQAQHYPLIFLGANAGYGWNEINSGVAIKGFFRYTVDAYIPGLQFEASYSTNLFKQLSENEIPYDEAGVSGKYISAIDMDDHQIAISASLHLRTFGKKAYIYLGGGGNINFLAMDSTVTDRYWDPVAEQEQELKKDPVRLLRQTLPGYHVYGGLRIATGGKFFHSFDIEVRKVIFPEGPTEWPERGALEYRDQSWDSWSINAGFTISIW